MSYIYKIVHCLEFYKSAKKKKSNIKQINEYIIRSLTLYKKPYTSIIIVKLLPIFFNTHYLIII